MNAVISDTNYTHPLYSLEFKIFGTGADIRLNDIPILSHDAEGQTSAQKPIPESIINGENILTIKSFPLKEANYQYQVRAYIEAIISVREKDGPMNSSKPLLQLKLNPTHQQDKLLDGTIEEYGNNNASVLNHANNTSIAQRSAIISSPFPQWAWQDGVDIENTEDNFNSLLKLYKEIWRSLNQSDINQVKIHYAPAAKEFATAYHYNDENEGHRIMNTGGMINENEWTLGDIEKFLQKREYIINIYANGLLAEIIDTKDKKSPIMYLNPSSRIISFQKFGFYKNKKMSGL